MKTPFKNQQFKLDQKVSLIENYRARCLECFLMGFPQIDWIKSEQKLQLKVADKSCKNR
ncbi:hypothetical protein M595_5470 [Lyngbya aestuarii BL J]|uniref:Uncharacterized protein n=1 Tax=Lyngbya aestuarii BL J TaxID=1348334 RepID=U7Q9V1_9CYAN|nr:hypothetical protein M595_5470 [Lyngbya aestuarii BL J]